MNVQMLIQTQQMHEHLTQTYCNVMHVVNDALLYTVLKRLASVWLCPGMFDATYISNLAFLILHAAVQAYVLNLRCINCCSFVFVYNLGRMFLHVCVRECHGLMSIKLVCLYSFLPPVANATASVLHLSPSLYSIAFKGCHCQVKTDCFLCHPCWDLFTQL